MPEDQKDEIINRLKGRGVKYFQIEQLKKSYKFERTPIKDKYGEEITYLRQLKLTNEKNGTIRFEILKNKMNSIALIGEIEIEIEREIDKQKLNLLAEHLKNNLFHSANKIYMSYYLKDNQNKDFAWATTNFDKNKIEVTINDY